jgi:hypothetical protein
MDLLRGRMRPGRVPAGESAGKKRSPWLFAEPEAAVEFDAVNPANIAPFAVFLTTDHAADITAARRDELFKEVEPSAYEGPRGYAKLPAH